MNFFIFIISTRMAIHPNIVAQIFQTDRKSSSISPRTMSLKVALYEKYLYGSQWESTETYFLIKFMESSVSKEILEYYFEPILKGQDVEKIYRIAVLNPELITPDVIKSVSQTAIKQLEHFYFIRIITIYFEDKDHVMFRPAAEGFYFHYRKKVANIRTLDDRMLHNAFSEFVYSLSDIFTDDSSFSQYKNFYVDDGSLTFDSIAKEIHGSNPAIKHHVRKFIRRNIANFTNEQICFLYNNNIKFNMFLF